MNHADTAHSTWVPFYMELADKLLAFKDDRTTLINKLAAAYEGILMKLPTLDSTPMPQDIDPYTVFGLFNKGISDANRRKIVAALKKEFAVLTALPQDFDGVPLLNNLNATFYAFASDERRGAYDIDNLWTLFEAEIALAQSDGTHYDLRAREAFIQAYDACIEQFGAGWKLTMGLYWVRPYRFINLDRRNRWFMGDMALAGDALADMSPKEKGVSVLSGAEYLALCNTALGAFDTGGCPYTDFPALSAAAFAESERVNQERKSAQRIADIETQDSSSADADVETVRFWLYAPGAGADMWDEFYKNGIMGLGWAELGDLSRYQSKEDMRQKLKAIRGGESSQKNSAHAVWQFVHDIKPGDVIFAKRGRSEILGRGVVVGNYAYDSSGGGFPNTRAVNWTDKGHWHTREMFAMKTLTDISNYTDFLASVKTLVAGNVPDEPAEPPEPEVSYPAYSKEDFLSEVFLSEDDYDTLCGLLSTKKNLILQGAPGVGKTFIAKRLAYSIMGVKDTERVMMVQFHQSYSYESFIEGFRPNAQGFDPTPTKGSFTTFCAAAADDTDNDYFFIIDEINRGNLSKIFGELFMLIENDKRGPKNKLQLLYSHDLFYVPSNVYIIGMMNTADRSLALLDYALRRRFAFFDIEPGFATEGFRSYCESLGSPAFNKLIACIERLNVAIAQDETLGRGFCIGHSYFCGFKTAEGIESKLATIVRFEILPMLAEYWFDEPDTVTRWSVELQRALE